MAMRNADDYECEHVHNVYQQIAAHFSATRYKAWPIVERFLKSLPSGSVGLDIGGGNGKYMAVNPDIYLVGSDRSSNLTRFAHSRALPLACADALIADAIYLPHQVRRFDFALSIAVIHHFSTADRRVKALKSIIETLSSSGIALVVVWALEQSNSRRGWTSDNSQDVMVPWVAQNKLIVPSRDQPLGFAREHSGLAQTSIFNRYYHLYRQGELKEDILAASGTVLESGYEKDNWWAIFKSQE